KDDQPFSLPEETSTSDTSFTFTPTDNGSYVVTCLVTDNDGGVGTLTTNPITVYNVNPTGTMSGVPESATEGDSINLTVNPSDAGSADTFSYSWSVTRDGEDYTLPESTDLTAASLSFIPVDNGSYVAICTVTDDDGGAVD